MADMDADGLLSQGDIDAALSAAGMESSSADEAPAEPEASAPAEASAESDARVDATGRPFDEVAAAMAAAIESEATAAPPMPVSPTGQPATPFDVPELGGGQRVTGAEAQGIDLLRDVDLNVKIELGRSKMLVDDVLRLGEGSVVELDKLAGDPVDVLVNDRLVARGEVLVLNDNFCVRINDIVSKNLEEEAVT